MELLKQMEEECDCIEVIFQDYIQSRSTKEIFLFFEGKDDYKYYWCRLSLYIGEKSYKKYDCNGKRNVLIIYDMIKRKTQQREQEKILYFIDKDFDKQNIAPEDIYMLPTYAIENLYISDKAIENMIIGEFGFSGEMDMEDKNDLNIAVKYLVTQRDEIIESMIYANAWYSLQKNKVNKPPYPKLSAIKEYDTIKNINDKEILQRLVPNSIPVSDEEMEKEINYLREKPHERLRGKYFEQIMPHYIMKVFEDSNKKANRKMFSKRRKVNLNIGVDNMVSVLSNYADVPNDLLSYINKRFQVDASV